MTEIDQTLLMVFAIHVPPIFLNFSGRHCGQYFSFAIFKLAVNEFEFNASDVWVAASQLEARLLRELLHAFYPDFKLKQHKTNNAAI